MVDKYKERIQGVYDAHSIQGMYPVPLIAIAETLLGYKVRDFVLTAENRHLSGVTFFDKKEILINPGEYGRRKNFILAHELGHIILGHGIYCDSEYDTRETVWNPEKGTREYDADELAAELLMPEDEFRRQWENCQYVPEIADFFEVSIRATKKRLEKLEIKYE